MIRVVSIVIALTGSALADDNARFSGLLANGERVSNAEIAWYDDDNPGRLAGKNILDESNPFRWLLDEGTAPVAAPAAYVEFVGGDRLPGRVTGIGGDDPFHRLPEHLVVEPSVLLDDPASQRLTSVRVALRSVARIAWKADRPRDLRPGTVFHLDGRETSIRTLRWSDGALLVLTPKGLETIPVSAVAEVHLPARDPWEVYAEEVALLSPDLDDLLVRWEATGGLVVTGSRRRFEPGHRGDRRRHEHWTHRVQPTWSLDPLWIRFDAVRSVRVWKPTEVPLSRVQPVAIERRSVFGTSWGPRSDASSQGTPLRSGGEPYGWGFGVHAHTELAFDLPPYAAGFATRFGLDEVVGTGGAVKGAVHVSAEAGGTAPGNRLWESLLVAGSGTVHDSGRLDVTAAATEGRRLLLVAEMAHGEQPKGGDPFDVRDTCDWLDPVLHLDRDRFAAEVRRHGVNAVPVLDDWRVDGEPALVLHTRWEKSDPYDPRYTLEVAVADPFAAWSRTFRVDRAQRWLAVGVHRRGDDDEPATHVQVRLDGRAIGEFEVPRWIDEWGPNPVLVPLAEEFRGREVDVELVVLPAKPGESFVEWRGVEPVEHPPFLIPVFDEDLRFARELRDGDGTAMVTLEDSRRGAASLVVSPAERGRVDLLGEGVPIRIRPRVGDFRYLRFAWRKAEGKRIALRLGHDGVFGVGDANVRPRIVREHASPFVARRHQARDTRGEEVGYTYDSSFGIPDGKAALRLDKKPPTDWQLVQRDLYNDFGEFTLTGFSFDALDGSAAYFDEVYLARKAGDFQFLDRPPYPVTVSPEFLVHERDPWRFERVLRTFAPGFTARLGDGVMLRREYRGRRGVLRTFGVDHNRPASLRRSFVPGEGSTKLVLEVAREDGHQWKLRVLVNGERRLSETIGNSLKTDEAGWARFEVDLSEFAGRPVVVDVQHARHNDSREAGYFAAIRVEHEPR